MGKQLSHPEGPRKVDRMSDRRELRGAGKGNQGGFIISSNLLLRHLPKAKKRPRESARAHTHTHTHTQGREMAVRGTKDAIFCLELANLVSTSYNHLYMEIFDLG